VNIAVSYHEGVTKLQEFGANPGGTNRRGTNGRGTVESDAGLTARAKTREGPFDRAEWFALLETHGKAPLVALAQTGDAKLALPLMRGDDGLEALTNWFSFTWRPISSQHDVATNGKLLRALASDLRSKTHAISFSPVADEHGDATLLAAAFREAGWRVTQHQSDENHVLEVNGRSFADYWATRPGRMRTTLKRKAKKVEVTLLDHFEESAWADYRTVYENSWKPEEEQSNLLEDFARSEAALGHLRLAIAHHDGAPVAAQFWTVENGTAFIHKLAHIEKAKALSAGTTLSAALFEHVIEADKVELIDFGTGSDAYKSDWMEVVRPRYRIACLDPKQPRSWPILAKQGLRRLASGVSGR
jgi:hypothetical protein